MLKDMVLKQDAIILVDCNYGDATLVYSINWLKSSKEPYLPTLK